MSPPRAIPSQQREDSGASRLRHHLIALRQREVAEELAQRNECEALLGNAMHLRNERRQLEQDIERCQRITFAARAATQRDEERWSKSERSRSQDLRMRQGNLKAAQAALERTEAPLEREEEMEECIERAKLRCESLQAARTEWDSARFAATELRGRLSERIGGLETEVGELRGEHAAQMTRPKGEVTPDEIQRLRREVKTLAANAAVASREMDYETRRLWMHGPEDLHRMRGVHYESRRLERLLMESEVDEVSMERDYETVIQGLKEHEMEREAGIFEMQVALQEARAEGQELARTMKENEARLREEGHERQETESFVRYLSEQLARLEDERNALRSAMWERDTTSSNSFSTMNERYGNPMMQSLQGLRGDSVRLVEEAHAGAMREEAEARAVGAQCNGLEAQLARERNRNLQLRQEASTLTPLLNTMYAGDAIASWALDTVDP